MDIPRVCFYHLVYAGRGSELVPTTWITRRPAGHVDLIIDGPGPARRGKPKEVLTVDNHADGPYLYLRLLKDNPERAEEVLALLRMNEGNSSGRGIGCVSWDGDVHADQFWRHHSFGNVRERPFSEIWTDTSRSADGAAQGEEAPRQGPLRRLPLAGRLRRQLPGPRRGGDGDLWAPGPGLLPHRRGDRLTEAPSGCRPGIRPRPDSPGVETRRSAEGGYFNFR
jgi:Fe-coproporphyrin III synthase